MIAGLVRIAQSRWALVLSGIGVIVFFWLQIARVLRQPHFPPGDAGIVFDHASTILTAGRYPEQLDPGNFHLVFPYPPAASILFGYLAKLGATGFLIVWCSLMLAGLFAAFRFALAYEIPVIRRAFVALMLPAILIVANPVIFDLSNLNNNLILLGVTMAAFALMSDHPRLGGALLAIPIALKLYVGALLVWLVIYRPRAAWTCIATSVVLWTVLPILMFGISASERLYLDWLQQVAIVGSRWVYDLPLNSGPPLIALRRAVALLTRSDPFAPASLATLYALQLAWGILLAVYAWRAFRYRRLDIRSRAALADWIVLLLAPLPFSPWLEPYHAVPALIACALCLLVAFDEMSAQRARMISTGTLALVVAVQIPPLPFEARGLVFLVQFAILTIALAWMRPALSGSHDPVRAGMRDGARIPV